MVERSFNDPLSPVQIAQKNTQPPSLVQGLPGFTTRNATRTEYKDTARYTQIASEFSTMHRYVLRGSRVVIATTARAKALAMMYEGHRGIVAMKACALSYVW